MRRLLFWLIPELALMSERERRGQHASLVAAWIGAVALALVMSLVAMTLDALVSDMALRTVLRPLVFTLLTLSITALVMRMSYRQSAVFYGEQAVLNGALEHQAFFDGLTDLPNRRQFHDRLQRSVDDSRERGLDPGFALLVVDLDDFKDVNDTLGRAVGDLLLQATAQRLLKVLRPQDMVARVGGDEFVVILAGQQIESARQVAARLLESVAVPLPLDGHVVRLSASIGIACCPSDGLNGDLLLRRSDLAMYAAKRTGAAYAMYTPDLEAAAHLIAA
jgi:diguanylate cyclase (GGDEF)-like protein